MPSKCHKKSKRLQYFENQSLSLTSGSMSLAYSECLQPQKRVCKWYDRPTKYNHWQI